MFVVAHPKPGAVSVSLVSHGHGAMVWSLVAQLLVLPDVARIILTLNIPEEVPETLDPRVLLIRNAQPKGFGANHNAAFQYSDTEVFCVLNPDIELIGNPFPRLLQTLMQDRVGVCAPLIIAANGRVEDSARRFMTPWRMILRKLGLMSGAYKLKLGFDIVFPEWVAGMFMLFNSAAYVKVGGFDESYFMYCEDADICTRLWQSRERILIDPSISVVHQAQRASRTNWRHLRWHVASMARYFVRYWGRLPRTDGSI